MQEFNRQEEQRKDREIDRQTDRQTEWETERFNTDVSTEGSIPLSVRTTWSPATAYRQESSLTDTPGEKSVGTSYEIVGY